MKKHGTLSQDLNRLRTEEGYREDFNLLDHILNSDEEREQFFAQDFVVDEVYRYEGMSNPGDEAILYAITTSSGQKGVLMDGYDYTSGQVSEELLKRLDLKSNRPI